MRGDTAIRHAESTSSRPADPMHVRGGQQGFGTKSWDSSTRDLVRQMTMERAGVLLVFGRLDARMEWIRSEPVMATPHVEQALTASAYSVR